MPTHQIISLIPGPVVLQSYSDQGVPNSVPVSGAPFSINCSIDEHRFYVGTYTEMPSIGALCLDSSRMAVESGSYTANPPRFLPFGEGCVVAHYAEQSSLNLSVGFERQESDGNVPLDLGFTWTNGNQNEPSGTDLGPIAASPTPPVQSIADRFALVLLGASLGRLTT